MKVMMQDKDGVIQTRYICSKHYDPERMLGIDGLFNLSERYRCLCCKRWMYANKQFCTNCGRFIRKLKKLRPIYPKRGAVKNPGKLSKSRKLYTDLNGHAMRDMIAGIRKKQETNPGLLKVR